MFKSTQRASEMKKLESDIRASRNQSTRKKACDSMPKNKIL